MTDNYFQPAAGQRVKITRSVHVDCGKGGVIESRGEKTPHGPRVWWVRLDGPHQVLTPVFACEMRRVR